MELLLDERDYKQYIKYNAQNAKWSQVQMRKVQLGTGIQRAKMGNLGNIV